MNHSKHQRDDESGDLCSRSLSLSSRRTYKWKNQRNSTEYNPAKRRRHSYVTGRQPSRAQRTDYLTKLLKEKSACYRASVNTRSSAEPEPILRDSLASWQYDRHLTIRLYKAAAAHHDLASKSTEKPPIRLHQNSLAIRISSVWINGSWIYWLAEMDVDSEIYFAVRARSRLSACVGFLSPVWIIIPQTRDNPKQSSTRLQRASRFLISDTLWMWSG